MEGSRGELSCDNIKFYYSGNPNKAGQCGTGFFVGDKLKNSIVRFYDRLCALRLKGKANKISLVCAYAPTEEADDEVKDAFYAALEDCCNKISAYDIKVVIGDFNAKIGKEQFNSRVAGLHTLHDIKSENGKRLCQFAAISVK